MLGGMSPVEAARWARERERGMWRFIVVRGILLFGVLTACVAVALLWVTAGEAYLVDVLSRPLPILGAVLVGGALWGWLIWAFAERRYRLARRE